MSIKTYLDKETFQTVTEKKPDFIDFPSFVICLQKPFKNQSNSLMLTLEEFDENTYDPKALNITVNSSYNSSYVQTDFNMEYLNSLVLGKCLLYEMKQKVNLLQFHRHQ